MIIVQELKQDINKKYTKDNNNLTDFNGNWNDVNNKRKNRKKSDI